MDRFRELKKKESDGPQQQEDFRAKLVAYRNLYGFLSQIVPFSDPKLEKLYTFGRMLLTKLPLPEGSGPLELDEDVNLLAKSYRLERIAT